MLQWAFLQGSWGFLESAGQGGVHTCLPHSSFFLMLELWDCTGYVCGQRKHLPSGGAALSLVASPLLSGPVPQGLALLHPSLASLSPFFKGSIGIAFFPEKRTCIYIIN